jgi:hypothetical protein
MSSNFSVIPEEMKKLFALSFLLCAFSAFAEEIPCPPVVPQTLPVAIDAVAKNCLNLFYAQTEKQAGFECLPGSPDTPSTKLLHEIISSRELNDSFQEKNWPVEMSLVNTERVKNNRKPGCAPLSINEFVNNDGCLNGEPLSKNACIKILTERNLLLTTDFLLKADAGVSEGYSIGCHSNRVVEIFDQQAKMVPAGAMKKLGQDLKLGDTNVQDLMRHVMALHDIGKSLSVIAGDKESFEEHFSTPMIGVLLAKLGYSQRAQRLGQALVDGHQILGAVLRNRISPAAAGAKIKEIIVRASDSFDAKAYLALQEKLYIADSTSYPLVCRTLFPIQAKKGSKMCLDNEKLSIDEWKNGAYQKIREEILKAAE